MVAPLSVDLIDIEINRSHLALNEMISETRGTFSVAKEVFKEISSA